MIYPHYRLPRPAASFSVTVPVKAEVFYPSHPRPRPLFLLKSCKSSDRRLCRKRLYMTVDHIKNLRRLRKILRKQRRELVATMVGAKKEPTKFAPLVELQEACDAVEWALDDEAAAAKEGENNEP